ncbi:MAG: type II toxin-antitoxin system VapC family toxin [Pseudomonadota bacterium]
MILLDTNVLSELMKPAPELAVIQWLDAQLDSQVFLPAITKAEIELGIALLPNGKRKNRFIQLADALFDEFQDRILPFDAGAASYYANLVATTRKAGRTISVEDAQIAAITQANRLTLATRNTKDFEFIPELLLINPWQMTG